MTDREPGLVGNAARASIAGISTLLLAVLLVIAGRLLGDEEYGKFSFALALAMIFETVIDFGLKEITTREVARNRQAAQALVAQTFGLKLALAVVSSVGLVLAANLLRPETDVRLACYLLGAASILRSYLLTPAVHPPRDRTVRPRRSPRGYRPVAAAGHRHGGPHRAASGWSGWRSGSSARA